MVQSEIKGYVQHDITAACRQQGTCEQVYI
jgi:hypothetical protein